ncbi:surfeit locus protein 1 [Schistocerca nitens]|uniref:surfeit locus protein 1 n=1 Tax=Schistocerca nitens TaxID=7011 RepID=UPI0021192964|nr:surfeit locus protein 1 [Schistocerca nitens]
MWRCISTAKLKSFVTEVRPPGKMFQQKRENFPPVMFLRQTRHNVSTVETRFRKAQDGNKKLKPFAWFLLLVPITTFALGTWQVKRRKWKLDLIADLESRTKQAPYDLPEDLSELEKMEYYPVRVKGRFDHSHELYLGPRSLIVDGDAANQGSLMSQNTKGQSGGYCVVTPFILSDRNSTILVNRGWVSSKQKNPGAREAGQIEGELELTGLVRLSEKRAPFMPANKPDAWFYRDVETMAEVLHTDPIFIDASAESSVPGGPQGGQTRVTLRNEHLSYILTWYGLSAATAIIWFRTFIHKTGKY